MFFLLFSHYRAPQCRKELNNSEILHECVLKREIIPACAGEEGINSGVYTHNRTTN